MYRSRGPILCTDLVGQSYRDMMHVQRTNQSYGYQPYMYRTEDTYMVYKGPQDACTEDRFVRMGTQCAYTTHRVSMYG